MQAVLLAAGNSSRLFPFGGQKHKSTITLLGKPLIVRTIESLVSIGITDVVVVVSPGNGVKECLDDADLSVPTTIVTHEGARGMGEALLDAKEHLKKTFLLVHAHHVDVAEHLPLLVDSLSEESVTLLIKKEDDLSAYGAVKLEGDRVKRLEEKPKHPEEFDYRVVGMYGLNEHFISSLEKVDKQHYSFEDALSSMAEKEIVKAVKTNKDVISLKYPFHLFDIANYLFTKQKQSISDTASVSQTATIDGDVIIESGAKIYDNATLKGPVYIGEHVVIGTNAIVREGVSIEKDSKVGANMEVKHSLIGENSTTHSGFLGDSIVGNNTKLAALFCSGNVRLDRKNIAMTIKDRKIDSGRNHVGAFIGNNVRVGIRASTMPGVVIGSNSFVGPQSVVFKNIDEGVAFYSKFEDVVIKDRPIDEKESNISDKTVVLFDIDYTLFDTGRFKASELKEYILYDEVIDVLDSLSGSVLLGVFSEGDLDFQKTKLLNTMIHDHFVKEHIHIVTDKHATISSIIDTYKDQKLILVDDKLEVLKMAKDISPFVHTIWVKRGPFATKADTTSFKPDWSVDTLDEVIKIVSNI